jgi:chromosome segregation ATPase
VQELKRIELMVADKFTLEDQLAEILDQRNQLAREKQQLAERERLTSESLAAVKTDKQALSQEILELQQAGRIESEKLVTVQSEKKTLIDRVQALLTRSSELDRQRSEAQNKIADLTINEAKLSQKIANLASQFDSLKIRSGSEINTLSTTNLSLSERLESVSSQLEQVKTLLQTEQQQRQQLGAQVGVQSQELLDKQELLEQLRLIQQQFEKRHTDANINIDRLTELISQRQAENTELQAMVDASGSKFRSLQEEYESLDVKYRELVRPARSSAGKYLVEVWIVKAAVGYRFQLKEPSQSTPVSYSRSELDRRLASLKAKQGKNLYTKVVIPEYSQLSYNEAWRFTQEILQGYDYYYQKYPEALGGSSAAQ